MKKIFFGSLIVTTFLFFFFTGSARAASFGFNSAASNISIGQKVKVDLLLNVTSSENVKGYDAYIKYPTNLLTYNPSDFLIGNVFTTGAHTVNSFSGDLISLGSYFDTNIQGTTTGGVVASLFFTGRAAGSAKIEIVCGSFTNIWKTGGDSVNLFTNCASLLPNAVIAVGTSGANPTSTPTATSTPAPGATSTPTPIPTSVSTGSGALTTLPETGNLDGILRLIYFGGGMLIVGGLLFIGLARRRS